MGSHGGTGDKGEDMRQARVINSYVASLGRPTRRLNRERLEERLLSLQQQLEGELTGVQRILTLQEADDIVARLEAADDKVERDFIKIIKDWAERHNVTYATLRQMNIPASVLRDAGMRP